jgi:hypothetical protein
MNPMFVDVSCKKCGARKRLDIGQPRAEQTLEEHVRLVIDPEMRKKGLGRIMLRELYHRAVLRGIEKIQAEVREDNGDFKLVYEEDDIIKFYYEEAVGTRAMRDFVSSEHPYGDGSWEDTTVPMNSLRSLWEGGEKLALRDISSKPRKCMANGMPKPCRICGNWEMCPKVSGM